MRDIQITKGRAMEDVRLLTGLKVKLKVNRGRNKIELIEGILENAYPNIFTVRKENGEINSFSYADVISRCVKIERNRV